MALNLGRLQIEIASGLNIIAGLWLTISPFVLGFLGVSNATNADMSAGLLVVVLALTRSLLASPYPWMSWANATIGIWILSSPWLLHFTAISSATWNNLLTGSVITVLGASSGLASIRPRRPALRH